ncbi:MAG: phosphoglucomutase/phosphomannomutase family protein [Candidatus Acidulodesulfobacterium acidiphilum]|uniref:Phosphoglucomutase/phosphomannomutase family protein n=1 Tax=Candidatus Acidulodesulfobacterium acidiphilum TaxID=2597224 RepID=A0A520XE57_9DELT|nr:MAG: phosphoglucomutase/phosphomannomutase family protein [Candidatus Acidulodesulfobacterium acidiphilum]
MSNSFEIEFGTSGYRGKIADDFTYESVKLVSQAVCDFLNEKYRGSFPSKQIVIGYDTRFLSEEFAKISACVFCANGFNVIFADTFTPTPVIAIKILKEKALGAINITASHNPYNYNGIKFSPDWGGPALPEDTEVLTKKSNELLKNPRYNFMDFNDAKKSGQLKEEDFIGYYIELVKSKLNLKLIKENAGNLYPFITSLHGTSKGIIGKIIGDEGYEFKEIYEGRDAFFAPGFAPDPSAKNLKDMGNMIKEYNKGKDEGKSKKIAIGLATDGDADRYGVLDEDGEFIEPNIIFPLLYNYYIEGKGIKGDAARSVATTALVDRVAKRYGFKVIETPVGFKYLGKLISEEKVIIAGEESSGLTVIGHTPDKDGIYTCLLVLEMLAYYKKPLKVLVKELLEKFGPIFTKRINVPVNKEKFKAEIDEKMEKFPNVFKGRKVTGKNVTDGYKVFFDDDSWLLARLSGTEDLMRIYGEADTEQNLDVLISAFQEYLI